jgi:hypothetical protein
MIYPETNIDEKPIRESLHELATRISRLEAHLGLAPVKADHSSHDSTSEKAIPLATQPLKYDGPGLELRIGEFGLAWIGIAVLFLGIVFLMAYTHGYGHRLLANVVGYTAVICLYSLARVWRHSIPHLSRMMEASGLLLLYYTTMRLSFFSDAPLIGNRYLAVSLLLLVVSLQLSLAIRRGSQTLAGIAILLAVLSALLADKAHITLPLVAISSALATYLSVARGWRHLLSLAIILSYTAHLLWLLSNPILGHAARAVPEHQYNLIYLFLYAVIFYWPARLGKKAPDEDAHTIFPVILNCLGFSIITGLSVLTHFQHNYSPIYLVAAGLFLLLSIGLWLDADRQYTPAIYACFGYMALSIAIYGYAKLPISFFWLSLQSLLVVLMSLWFRSRTLVVMNALIYVSVLLAYFATSPSSNPINFSFAMVAFISAWVVSWQKERLALRTDLLKNIYHVIGFVLVFYALYRAVPGQYVTLSWAATAVIYSLLSYLLRSIKYRLMAISAMLVTVAYLFLIDLAHLDPLFRVAAFLFVGFIALGISLFSTKARFLISKSGDEDGHTQQSSNATHS